MNEVVQRYAQHKLLLSGSLFCIVCFVFEFMASPFSDLPTVIVDVAYLMALLVVPLYPIAGSMILCVIGVAMSVVPVTFHGPSNYAGMWMAIGVLGFQCNLIYSFIFASFLSISSALDVIFSLFLYI